MNLEGEYVDFEEIKSNKVTPEVDEVIEVEVEEVPNSSGKIKMKGVGCDIWKLNDIWGVEPSIFDKENLFK